MVGPSAKRNAFEYLYEKYKVSKSMICRTLNLYRSTLRRTSIKDDSEVEQKLLILAEKYSTRGFDWYYGRIRLEGLKWNRKRVLRVYRKLKLKMRRKHKRRINRPYTEGLSQPIMPNVTWSMDFMSDALEDGRRVRLLNILEDYNRECLAIEVGLSISAERVTRVLDWIIENKGMPIEIRTDNGPEFTSFHYLSWCEANGIKAKFIQPGKPKQNGYIERFNRTFREDVLDAYLFESIDQLQMKADWWKEEYNSGHPHQSLKGMSPIMFKYSRSKIIDAYDSVKAKLNGSDEPALTESSSSMGWPLHEYLME